MKSILGVGERVVATLPVQPRLGADPKEAPAATSRLTAPQPEQAVNGVIIVKRRHSTWVQYHIMAMLYVQPRLGG